MIIFSWDHILNPQFFTRKYLYANKLHNYILYNPPTSFPWFGPANRYLCLTGKSGNFTSSFFLSTQLHHFFASWRIWVQLRAIPAEELSNSWQFCWAYLQKQLVNTDSNCCVPVAIILLFQTWTFIALFCLGLMNSLIFKDHLLGHWETRSQHDTSSHSLKRFWGKSEASGYHVEVWNRCKLYCDLSD